MRYNEKYDDLLLSDIDEMRKRVPPQDKPGKSSILAFINIYV